MKLALVSIMLNEEAYIERWIAGIDRTVFDDVVVVDGGSRDQTVALLNKAGIRVIERKFPDDFADQRNFAVSQALGDWIFELDADEVISAPLLREVKALTADATRDGVFSIGIPRLNFVDGVLVMSPGAYGLDFQYRLHHRGMHVGRVHTDVVDPVTAVIGNRVELRIADGRFIVHNKSSWRHEARNAYYRSLM